MLSFGEVVGTIGTTIKLVEGIFRSVRIGVDFGERAHYGRILDAIRQLYFFEDGTIRVLKKVANGESVNSLDFEKASARFFNAGEDVYRAIDRLVEYEERGRAGLSIKNANDLKRIVSMKLGARIDIEEFIYELSQQYPSSDKEQKERFGRQAKQVIALIEELNAAIERVDDSLRKSGG
jgi:hypothetical protein